MMRLSILGLLLVSAPVFAGPYDIPPPPAPVVDAAAHSVIAPPPVARAARDVAAEYQDARAIMDTMQLVGRKGNYIRLTWAQPGGAGGQRVKVWQGLSGDVLMIGGHEFRVLAMKYSHSVSLVLPNRDSSVVLMLDFDNPPVYTYTPSMADYQFIPPISGGVGVRGVGGAVPGGTGAGSSSASSSASPVNGAPQAATGVTR